MLHLLHGPDDFSSSAAVTALLAAYAGEAIGPQVVRLDGPSCSWAALQEACLTMTLLAPAQLVVVRGLLGHWSGRGEGGEGRSSSYPRAEIAPRGGKANSGARPSAAEFAAFAGALPSTTELILQEGELSAGNRYLKELAGLPATLLDLRTFPLPVGSARQRWIAETVRARGGSIDQSAATLLAERRPGDLWPLSYAIDQLLAYSAPQQAIGPDDVAALIPAVEDASAFALVDALTEGQAARVVDLLERLLAHGEAPEAILALVNARIRDLALLAAAQAEGIGAADLQQQTGWSPGRLAHLQRSRQAFSPAELRAAQGLLVATDLALKSRPSHERPLVTLLALLALAQRRGASELAAALAL